MAPLSTIMLLMAKAGVWEDALNFLKSAPARTGLQPDTNSYAKLGMGCAQSGKREAASRVYDAMIEAVGAKAVSNSACGRRFRDAIMHSRLRRLLLSKSPLMGGIE